MQLLLVVGDRELDRCAGSAVFVGDREMDALFKLRGIDRIVEVELLDHLLRIGVLRVLIELALVQRGRERHRVEFETILRDMHLWRQQGVRVETHREVLADRPVGRGHELQGVVVTPFPFALERGADRDAPGDGVAHVFDRCRRTRKRHYQRMDDGCFLLLPAVVGNGGRGNLEGHPWRMRTVLIPLPAKPCGGEERHHRDEDAGRRAWPGRHDPHPARRGPGEVTQQWTQQEGQHTTEAAQHPQRQHRQPPQEIHSPSPLLIARPRYPSTASLIKDRGRYMAMRGKPCVSGPPPGLLSDHASRDRPRQSEVSRAPCLSCCRNRNACP